MGPVITLDWLNSKGGVTEAHPGMSCLRHREASGVDGKPTGDLVDGDADKLGILRPLLGSEVVSGNGAGEGGGLG